MSELAVLNNQELTISSCEIAELTNKKHKNVIRDIEHMFNELKFEPIKFESKYIDSKGRQHKC